jgi:hypothetical protein
MFERRLHLGLSLIVVIIYACISVIFVGSSKNIVDSTCENAQVDYLHLPLNEEVHLDSAHNSQYARQWFGWYDPEPWGMWSRGGSAFLYVNASGPTSGDLCILISGRSSLSAKHPKNRTRIFIGGQYIGEFVQTLEQPNVKGSIHIPRSAFEAAPNGNVVLKLTSSDATSPSWTGLNSDTRVLGFGLSSLQLVQCAH